MIRARHQEASTVLLKHLKLELPKHPLSQEIFVDAFYFGRVPTTEDPEGRQELWIYMATVCISVLSVLCHFQFHWLVFLLAINLCMLKL